MTLGELRAQVRQHTVILPTAHLSDDQIDEFIQTSIERLEQGHDWRFQQYSVQIPFPPIVSGQPVIDNVDLPDDFVVEAFVYTVATNGSLVPVFRLEAGRRAWAIQNNSPTLNESYPIPSVDAQYYYIWQQRLYLVPPPSGDPVTIQLDYFRAFPRPAIATDETGFLQYHPRAVLWGALQVAYLYLHEVEMSQGVASIYGDLTQGAAARDHGARVGATQQPRSR